MNYLKINNADVSSLVASMNITHEPVWSSNAGRTLSADFVGDIIAWKWKIEFTTIPLTQKQSAFIHSLVSSKAFFNVSFIPPNSESDTLKTITAYTNAPSQTVYSYNKNLVRYGNISIHLIER